MNAPEDKQSKLKPLLGIVLLILALTAICSTATQYAAARLGYHLEMSF